MVSTQIATGWQLYLGSLALGSVAICGMALFATWLLRRRSAPVRHGLLLTALSLTALSPALVGLALVLDWGWRVDLAARRNALAAKTVDDRATTTIRLPLRRSSAPPAAVSQHHSDEPAPADAAPEVASPQPSPSTLIDLATALPVLWFVLTLVWGLGTTVCLARLARGISILARLRRSLVAPADGRLAIQLRQSLERLNTRRRALIGESSLAPAPLSFGLLRPVIVLPVALSKELDDEQLRLVLAHEAAHVARRDHCVALIERLAVALFWWNLLLRRVNHRLAQLREEICDDCAAGGSHERRQLAEVLVKIAGWNPPVPLRIEGATALVDDARDGLAARVGRLVGAWPRSIRLSRRAAVGVAAFGLALAGVVVMSTLRAEDGATRKTERLLYGQALIAELRQQGISLFEDPTTGTWQVHALGGEASDTAIAKIERVGRIGGLNLTSDKLTDACMEYVGRMTDLTKLAINAGTISDEGLVHLARLDKLTELSISSPRVTDAGLAHLKDLPLLARVTLLGVNVSDAGLRHLQDYPALVDLNVSGSRRRVSDEGMRYLAADPRLANLTIASDQVTDEGLRSLSASPSIARLSLQGEGFSDEGLRALAGLNSLRDLTVTGNRIGPEGVRYLKAAGDLESLGLYRCPRLNDDSLAAVGEITQLRRLALGGEEMTDAGLAHLNGLDRLQNLILAGPKLTGDGLKHLTGCRELTDINAHGERIGDEVFPHVNQFPTLRVLHVGAGKPTKSPRITNAGLARLQSASLEYIFFVGTGITDAGLAALDTLPSLRSAHFAWTPGVTNGLWQRNQQRPPAPAALNPNAAADGRVHESLLHDREQAAIWFHREGHESEVTFVLFHRGFLQTGLAYTEYDHSWNYKGHVHILDKRKFALEYYSDDPKTIVLDGKPFDARNGRVIVLDVAGDPVQLALAPPAARQENLAELSRRIAETRPDVAATTDPEAIIAELKETFGKDAVYVSQNRGQDSLRIQLRGPKVTDALVERVARLADVVSLWLFDSEITDAAMESIGRMTGLENLQIGSKHVADAGLKHVAGLRNLEFLVLSYPQVTDAGLAHVADLPNLKHFVLLSPTITDEGARQLAACKSLEWVHLSSERITDEGIRSLADIGSLTGIELNSKLITDDGLRPLLNVQGLRTVYLFSPKITDAGLAILGQLTSLVGLNLSNARITDAGLQQLQNLTGLEQLTLEGTSVTGEGLKYLTNWPRLRVLKLTGEPVNDSLFDHLRQFPKLFNLNAGGGPAPLAERGITDAGLKRLVENPGIRILYFDYTRITDAGVESLAALPELENVFFRYSPAVTDAGVAKLKAARPKLQVGQYADARPDVRPGHSAAAAQNRVSPRSAADGGGAVAEADRSELSVTVNLEDDAREPLKFVLLDTYSRAKKTWENVAPGRVRLELPELESDRYLLEISAAGYGKRNLQIMVSKEEISANAESLALYRRRYAVLRYVANTQGERKLTGPNVKEGRVAISYGNVPDLHGDWMIRQDTDTPLFSPHRYQAGNGFARPPAGTKFEDIDLAPQPDQYKGEIIAAEKGMVLLNHIVGDGPGWRRYAKILVEDVTETPPKDIQIIDTLLPPTILKARPVAKAADPASDRTSGLVTAMVSLEDDARAPVKLELRDNFGKMLKVWNSGEPGEIRATLPELEHDRYSLAASAEGYSPVRTEIKVSDEGVEPADAQFELYRIRYLVLRYAMNTKGERNLTGANVKGGRVAILFGKIPELQDWSVGQSNGQLKVIVHRVLHNTGFAPAAEGASFEELDLAPPTEDYSPDEFTFEKGMILFNRVVGHRPEFARYAKLLVEDITETRPENLTIIDSRPN